MADSIQSAAGAVTKLDWTDDQIAVLTLDQPGRSANILSASVLTEFESRLDAIDAKGNARGLIIVSAKPGIYIAGADLTEFAASVDHPAEEIIELSRKGQDLLPDSREQITQPSLQLTAYASVVAWRWPFGVIVVSLLTHLLRNLRFQK